LYYDRTGEWWGTLTISEQDRQQAADIERLSGPGIKRILELGAGFGGTASATADLGHWVVAVEQSPVRAQYARALAREPRRGALTVLEADFYTVELDARFDTVCYWNGFGMGSDADQRRLLRRICGSWLAPDGCLLMHVYSPWWWSRRAGQEERKPGRLVQGFDFDPIACRLIDSWWPVYDRSQDVAECIRCYSPMDLLLLLEGTGFALAFAEVDGQSIELVPANTSTHPLWDTWKYLVKLVPDAQTQVT
jgi:SAM-dependent methyltransferase